MYPHERSLVEEYGDKFAIVGINSDSKKRYLSAIEKEEITWRSFWDGGRTGGPIATQWGVQGWPTAYILDHNGIIRSVNPQRQRNGEEKMEQIIQELVALVPDSDSPETPDESASDTEATQDTDASSDE